MNAFNYFLVSSGLLSPEHRRRIGIAIWEFAWLIDRQFKPKNGDADTGLVLNGETITAGRIASGLGLSIRTVKRNLETLEAEKYIRTEEISGMGKRYFIANPKRWHFSTHDRSDTDTQDRSVTGSGQKCHAPHDRSVIANKESRLSRLQDSKTSGQPSAGNVGSSSQPRPKKAIPAFEASTMEIPEWLPRHAWIEFVGHRKDITAPLTKRAAVLAVGTLEKLRAAGQAPEAVIEQSILKRWVGLFAVSENRKSQSMSQAKPVSATEKTRALMAAEAQQPRRVM